MDKRRFAVAVAAIALAFGGSVLNAHAGLTPVLMQPAGTKLVISNTPLSRNFLQMLARKPGPILIIRKTIPQKIAILGSTSGMASGSTGGGSGGGSGSGSNVVPSVQSAVVNMSNTVATNSFGSNDQVYLEAFNPYSFSYNFCNFNSDPDLSLSSTQFDQSGYIMALYINTNDTAASQFLVDFTVTLASAVNTNYIVASGNINAILSGSSQPTYTITPANPNANIASATQDVDVLVQGNNSIAFLQCPASWDFVSAEVTPIN